MTTTNSKQALEWATRAAQKIHDNDAGSIWKFDEAAAIIAAEAPDVEELVEAAEDVLQRFNNLHSQLCPTAASPASLRLGSELAKWRGK
ncbi:MAG: hypothetical protein L0Z53_09045 [Acidobacteriales bacterium]|nr:hypothetical protein [Terriglobales bacterium]